LSKYLNFDAVRKPKLRDKIYKRVKTFKDIVKAEEYLEEMKKEYPSKRFPPFIEETSIGLRLGCVYRVCIPILKQ